ncbi:hypothetical protein ACFXPA_49250 [Amycolatopsis sp. NPDC059090]|uniref:hypothetical protein n=1 Tax=unclassified Amycolatopsis TaxID=2618356 RepID=UPI00366C2773
MQRDTVRAAQITRLVKAMKDDQQTQTCLGPGPNNRDRDPVLQRMLDRSAAALRRVEANSTPEEIRAARAIAYH